jgi:AraC-like DNA-binding protein
MTLGRNTIVGRPLASPSQKKDQFAPGREPSCAPEATSEEMMRMTSRSMRSTSIRLVWPFLALAQKHGHNVRPVYDRLGLTERELYDPETRVPQHLLANLLDEAIRRGGERDIGLMAAQWVDGVHPGLYEHIARASSTLGALLQNTQRYLPMFGDGAGHRMIPDGEQVIGRLWFDPQLEIHEAAYEFVFALSVLAMRRISGNPERAPLAVRFRHARPARTARHEQLFRCPMHFGAAHNEMVMSRRALEAPLGQPEPILAELLERQTQIVLERLPRREGVASNVRALLAEQRDLRAVSRQQVARRLGMSPRTLLRRLEQEGTHFRVVFDDVRLQLALHELTVGAQPLSEIADRLGFATPQSFHRAFKRWTGETPQSARRRAKRT